MFVAAVRFELHLPQVRSLKAKRAVVRPLVEGIRHRFHCAAAEVAAHDQWQRAVIGVAVVSSTAGHASEVLDAVDRFVWSFPEVEVSAAVRSWME